MGLRIDHDERIEASVPPSSRPMLLKPPRKPPTRPLAPLAGAPHWHPRAPHWAGISRISRPASGKMRAAPNKDFGTYGAVSGCRWGAKSNGPLRTWGYPCHGGGYGGAVSPDVPKGREEGGDTPPWHG